MKKTIIMSAIMASTLIYFSFRPADKKPWNVPDKDAKIANPVKSSPETIGDGKALWEKNCMSCHGKMGLGDGTKASKLKTEPGDFSTADFQKQSDGSLFYKTAEGRDDMPSYKKKITDAKDMWKLVVYMRTFKK